MAMNPIWAVNPFWMPSVGQSVPSASRPAGLMGDQPATGAGLMGRFGFGRDANPASQDALMAMAATLLAGSGWSPERRSGAEILGQALLAGQQARAQSQERQQKQKYIEAQIKNLEEETQKRSPFGTIDPDQFTPESLAEFQQSGNYGVLKPRGGLSGIGNFNPGDYTPESFSKFLKSQNPADLVRYVAPAQPSVQVVNGVPTVVQPTRGGGPTIQDPLSSLQSEAAAAAALAAEKARGGAVGTATGEATGGQIKKAVGAQGVLDTLNIADPLIDVATGSLSGAAADKVAAFFGKALDGAKATAQLKILQTNLVLNMPRMEGPQSNFDAQMYVEAAGSIGDPTVPREMKKAAVQTIRQLQQKYQQQPSNASPSGYQIVPPGSDEAQAGKATNIQSLLDKYPPRK